METSIYEGKSYFVRPIDLKANDRFNSLFNIKRLGVVEGKYIQKLISDYDLKVSDHKSFLEISDADDSIVARATLIDIVNGDFDDIFVKKPIAAPATIVNT